MLFPPTPGSTADTELAVDPVAASDPVAAGGGELVLAAAGPPPAAGVPARLADTLDELVRAGKAASTWRAYDADWRHFRAWCDREGLAALPAAPTTIAAYLADHAGPRGTPGALAVSTLGRRLAALSVAHLAAGVDPPPTRAPEVTSVWNGIRRTYTVAPAQVTPTRTRDIRAMIDAMDLTGPAAPRLADLRDRALLLIAYSGALRRSELVALDVDDLPEDDHGLRLHIRRSKTDQDGAGALVGLPYGSRLPTCPVRAWRAWTAAAGLTDGPAFRGIDRHGHLAAKRLSDRAVADILARRAAAAGLTGRFAGHSTRRGFATEAYAHGVPEPAVMRQGRWKSRTTMDRYREDGTVWDDNAAARLGL
ncbi:tyrosine-type recombinase/integrase [Frankia sp. CH37]|nr:tyrosine-type recombinase/integrase [Parafrankia sp. CH37]MBE3206722.1 tyrosine-type recombinase/integrase [Parafrankia sp. CH37]